MYSKILAISLISTESMSSPNLKFDGVMLKIDYLCVHLKWNDSVTGHTVVKSLKHIPQFNTTFPVYCHSYVPSSSWTKLQLSGLTSRFLLVLQLFCSISERSFTMKSCELCVPDFWKGLRFESPPLNNELSNITCFWFNPISESSALTFKPSETVDEQSVREPRVSFNVLSLWDVSAMIYL